MLIAKFTILAIDNIELVIVLILIFYSTFSLFEKKDFLSIIKYLFVSLLSLLLYLKLYIGFFSSIVLLK